MPIVDTDLIWRPSALISDTIPAQNGGRMNSGVAISSGVKNNLFPDVSQAERLAGSVKRRKAFIHAAPASNTPLLSARVFMDTVTPGDDFVVFYKGSETDIESAMAFPSRPYGVAAVTTQANAGQKVVVCTPESIGFYTSDTPFRIGDAVRIANVLATGGTGTEEYGVIDTVSYGASTITITLVANLSNTYTPASGALVSTVLEVPSTESVVSAIQKTSVGGTFTGSNLQGSSKGGIVQNWTITFDTPTSFSCVGDTVGAVTGGTTSSDFAPLNPVNSSPYFNLKSLCWSGTWASGNTVTFTTGVSAIPVWYERHVPAGCASLSNNSCSLAVQGESA